MSNTKQNKNEVTNVTSITKYVAPKKVYTYEGKKNVTEFPKFLALCKATQEELKDILPQLLIDAGYTDVVIGDGYIYATGDIPVLLTAHLDTVHKEPVKDFYENVRDGKHIISSPQGIGGDDRCGVYMILEIIKKYKPHILFCEDEEVGGIGSDKFCKTDLINELADLKFLVELDRANETDAVFYDCDNPEFTKFITETTGYKKDWGSFSDISNLAPVCGVAAVNLSCGYYNAHTLGEYVVVEEMLNTIEVVKKLLETESEQFEYIEKKYGGYYGGYGYYGRGYDCYDDGYDDWYGKYSEKSTSTSTLDYIIYVTFKCDNGEIKTLPYVGTTRERALVAFLDANPNVRWDDVIDYEYDWA